MSVRAKTQPTNEPNWTQQTWSQPIKTSNLRWVKYFIYFVCGVLIAYSVIPWQSAGQAIGTEIVSLPLIQQLQTVPLLGLLISLIAWILPNLMSVLLWGLCQLIEIAPILLNDTEVYDAVIRQLRTYEAAPPSGHPDLEKFQQKLTHYILDIFRNIGRYAALAYVSEVVVNVWFYLPYGNGWDDFMRDFTVWDASLIQWSEFFLMLGSIAIVEVLGLFLLNVHRLFKAISPRTERPI